MMAGPIGAVPLAAFLIIWGLATTFIKRPVCHENWRPRWRAYAKAFLFAALTWGVYVTIITEGLSAFHALTATTLALWWLALALAGVGMLIWVTWRRRHVVMRGTPEPLVAPSDITSGQVAPIDDASSELDAGAWYISLGIAAIVLIVTGLIAWVSPPNNWDAMTYHLARVQHWIQNQSVDFYPTNDPRQLFDPPWAEYAVLQFQLLTGGDHLANFVQWFSSLGTCVAVPLIAQQLGANRAGQGLAMVLAATTPMAILQSSSPQNDLVTSFWLTCCVYFALRFAHERGIVNACALGVALGLATLTKGTAYVFAAPIVLGLALWLITHLRRHHRHRLTVNRIWGSALSLLCLAAVLLLALNGAQDARNIATFHSPLGPDSAAYANQTFAPTALACNTARIITLELGVSSAAINDGIYHAAVGICHAVGVNASDPRITWTGQGGPPFMVSAANTSQSIAGNLAQFALIVLALALVLALPRLRARRLVVIYAALLLVGYLLFTCYIRWQLWGNRLLLPWFMAAAPLVGVVLDRLFARRLSLPLVELALLVLAAPYLLLNHNAPLVGASTTLNTPRITQYFVANQPDGQLYRDAADYINQRGCLAIGFHAPIDTWEYPLWLLIGTKPYQAHIEQVLVDNASARYASEPRYQRFHPCAIFDVAASSAPEPAVLSFHGTVFRPAWTEGPVIVYVPSAR